MGRERLKVTHCNLQVTNAQTMEEYTDDNALIPGNSSVTVRRVPVRGVKATGKTDLGPPRPQKILGTAFRSQTEPASRTSKEDGDVIKKPPSMDLASKKCQQVLTELEEMFQRLEIMFSLTLVPRVLILLGGNVMSPKELCELSLEGICEGGVEESLRTASCVRKLFHSLFVADVFSELKALPVMGTVVMLQGHRDCGVDWFRPKLNYKVPTRGRKLAVNLSCDGDINRSASASQHVTSTWEDYVWFQAPAALKGFHE